MKKVIKFFILTFSFFFFLNYLDYDDRFLYLLASDRLEKIDINRNLNIKLLKAIPKINKNLSGITYSPHTDTLFAITNSPRNIYELTKKGEVLRKIDLSGFKDTEDISYIKEKLFAIVDEKHNTFYIVKINKNTTKIDISNKIKQVSLDYNNFENFGLEGITYNTSSDEFYLVNEKFPKKMILVEGLINKDRITIRTHDNIAKNNLYLGDFSGIHFNNLRKELFVISGESKILLI